MSNIIGFAVTALFALGCSKSETELERLRNEACACKDKACADAVETQIYAYTAKPKDRHETEPEDVLNVYAEALFCISELK